MNRQETDGRARKLTGRVKEAAGIVVGNRALERAGARQRAEGAARENLGRARRKVGDAVAKIAKSIDK